MSVLPVSISVVRDGRQVPTNRAEPTDVFPGFGPKDPVTRADTDGTYEEFTVAYVTAHVS